MYLATPAEIAAQLRITAKGRGDTILHERKEWTARAHAAGTVDAVPDAWKFTEQRLKQLAACI